MSNEAILEWIDSVLSPEVRAKVEHMVQANNAASQPLIKQLQALRAQLRENAYQKIYEARAGVADDLLKLTQSLTQLIHYSNVAGEDTSAYISLMRSVSQVTQKLSFFGEDDADGDGVKDSEEAGLDPASDLELDIDETNPEPKPEDVIKPQDEVKDEAETEDENVDPDSVKPEDAAQEPSEEPAGEDVEMTDDESGEGDAEQSNNFDDDFEKAVKSMPKQKKAAEQDDEQAEPDGEESAEEPSEDDEQEDGEPKKKKGFLAKLDDAEPEEETAESSTQVLSAAENKFRFAYLGISPSKQKISAVVTDTIYEYKPESTLFGGDVKRLDTAIRKLLASEAGYSAVLLKLNSLVKAKKLKIVARKDIKGNDLRNSLKSPVDQGQLGENEVPEGTPWRYRGIGLQKVKNNQVCIWFEVGSKEYAAVPNTKSLKAGEDIDGFDARVQGKLKTLSYDDGLGFIIGLIERGHLKPIFVGPIG